MESGNMAPLSSAWHYLIRKRTGNAFVIGQKRPPSFSYPPPLSYHLAVPRDV